MQSELEPEEVASPSVPIERIRLVAIQSARIRNPWYVSIIIVMAITAVAVLHLVGVGDAYAVACGLGVVTLMAVAGEQRQ